MIVVIHSKTQSVLENLGAIYTDELADTIAKIIRLVDQFSPLSDLEFICSKLVRKIASIRKPQYNSQWMPIRNILRILARAAQIDSDIKISGVQIDDMRCGCDFFEGNLTLFREDGSIIMGPYKWQWTAFSGYDRHFDKFKIFPDAQNIIKLNQLTEQRILN